MAVHKSTHTWTPRGPRLSYWLTGTAPEGVLHTSVHTTELHDFAFECYYSKCPQVQIMKLKWCKCDIWPQVESRKRVFFFISKSGDPCKIHLWTALTNKLLCSGLARVRSFDRYSTLNQQTGSVEHLSLVTVGSARVRPSVISSDAKYGEAAIMYLRWHVQEKQI